MFQELGNLNYCFTDVYAILEIFVCPLYSIIIIKTIRTRKVLKARYITNTWQNCHLQVATELQATYYGWQEEEGKYTFKWFEGPQIPEKVSDIVLENESDSFSATIQLKF